ncbi:hypothetical protein KP509_03G049500 [Ceratopteris richardii]|uniref:Uncharacterized protein n=1 Tax=Ceratopteris richardii TaxID=49495 RepID=A0A8T2V6R0_CERRI|nr:hypothetical protein KP509_03G049500 [Ceratopteris richardii]
MTLILVVKISRLQSLSSLALFSFSILKTCARVFDLHGSQIHLILVNLTLRNFGFANQFLQWRTSCNCIRNDLCYVNVCLIWPIQTVIILEWIDVLIKSLNSLFQFSTHEHKIECPAYYIES